MTEEEIAHEVWELTPTGRLVSLIQCRYRTYDGEPLTLQNAEQLLGRLDQEADYLGAYVDTED